MPQRRRNKFGAHRVQIDGHWFDSKREAETYRKLKVLLDHRKIHTLVLQPHFRFKLPSSGEYLRVRSKGYPNGRMVTYRADFSFIENGRKRVIDVKGMDTDVSRLKRALVELFHGIQVEVWK